MTDLGVSSPAAKGPPAMGPETVCELEEEGVRHCMTYLLFVQSSGLLMG